MNCNLCAKKIIECSSFLAKDGTPLPYPGLPSGWWRNNRTWISQMSWVSCKKWKEQSVLINNEKGRGKKIKEDCHLPPFLHLLPCYITTFSAGHNHPEAFRMAHPTVPTQQAARSRHSSLLRLIAIIILALIVLVGLAVLIIWLAVKPKGLVYVLEDGSIHGFSLGNNHLNATFDFVLRAYNPNKKVSIYYDSMEVSAAYDDQTLATDGLQPFFQSHRNVTRLQIKLVAQSLLLSGSVSKELQQEKSSGKVELELRVKAKIRFKVGIWKSQHRTLRVFCLPVVNFSHKDFERTPCEIDL